ncbi:MAG: hypothetical protein FJ197_02340 [Gammaproteobacteria bacterium]|nr:hypothetical protein [Gammaproteobacteria bacterium]
MRGGLAKHLTAAVFAVLMSGLLVLGFDGLLRGMQRLAKLFAAASPAATAPQPAPATTPGVMPVIVLPPATGVSDDSSQGAHP